MRRGTRRRRRKKKWRRRRRRIGREGQTSILRRGEGEEGAQATNVVLGAAEAPHLQGGGVGEEGGGERQGRRATPHPGYMEQVTPPM